MGLLKKTLEESKRSSKRLSSTDFLCKSERDESQIESNLTPSTTVAQKPEAPTTKDTAQRLSGLQRSANKLLRMQSELKGLSVMQVESNDGDIVPEGIITGKFDIERTLDSKRWLFNLLTTSGNVIATSRVYSSIAAVMGGIHSVIANSEKASLEDQTLKKAEIRSFPKWVIYLDNRERYNFILYASNGNPVVHSHGYSSKSYCKKGIESVIDACKNPMIEKTYLHHK